MSDPKALADAFLSAVASGDPARYEQVLAEDAGARIWRWDGLEIHRPRERLVGRLLEEWRAWPDATLEALGALAHGGRAAVEFRIQATEGGRYVEHNRSAFLTVADGRIGMIDMYCAEPLPSARRAGWVAPATLSDAEASGLLGSFIFSYDSREFVPPLLSSRLSLRLGCGGNGDAHPGSNEVYAARWSAEEADARIEEIVEHHRGKNVGFSWFVGPHDTPADLGERLERRGFVRAGDQAVMARVGLDDLDIPTNPQVAVEVVDGADDAAIEAVVQIVARSFSWTPEQVDLRRPIFFERIKSAAFRDRQVQYLARLGGVPVADAALLFQGGVAYLGGASTLPEFRNRKIYSTLLRRRLEEARARGYAIAAINAEPMSRRVVSRYGFKEFARYVIYAWMPVIDMEVIRTLVPND